MQFDREIIQYPVLRERREKKKELITPYVMIGNSTKNRVTGLYFLFCTLILINKWLPTN